MTKKDKEEIAIAALVASPAYGGPFEFDLYKCYLVSFDEKFATMKLLREVLGVKTPDAFSLMTKLPVCVGSDLSKPELDELVKRFTDIGCEVEIRENVV
jgi:ribosomal protein L7/L12